MNRHASFIHDFNTSQYIILTISKRNTFAISRLLCCLDIYQEMKSFLLSVLRDARLLEDSGFITRMLRMLKEDSSLQYTLI